MHLGDMGEAHVLDQLASLAPALATRGGDDPARDERIAPVRLLEAGGLAIAAGFELGSVIAGAKSEGLALPPGRIDAVNPGSATLPMQRGPSGLGAVARLALGGSAVRVEIVQL